MSPRLRTQNPRERFERKISVKESGCWEWMANKNHRGYGRFWLNGRQEAAHRYAWELANGPIPDGLWVLHRCDNPGCVRPDHLFLGDARDNVRDMIEKGRRAPLHGERSHCHKLSNEIVAEIRAQHMAGALGLQKSVGEKYGVSPQTISRVINRRTWRQP